MSSTPRGQCVLVTFLQSDGTSGASIMFQRNEAEIIARGHIFIKPEDSLIMIKARIKDLLSELLPTYRGSFSLVYPFEELIKHLLNVGGNEDMENIYVRLSQPFLDAPPPHEVRLIPIVRKRSRPLSPEEPTIIRLNVKPFASGSGGFMAAPLIPPYMGGTDKPPSKKSRKDVWQTDEGDPMDVLRDLIAKHLYGFVSAPGLKHIAREIAMSAYFDWLDKVEPKHPGHVVIVGNPGVGKTTGAWALAKFLAESGIVRSENVVEAHRDDLVDKYVGGTELKTNIVIHSARGGVVIFDEIYALNKPSSPNDSGKEALTTIMKYMTKDLSPVFMFLGYKKQMKDFVNMNPGFQRRIKYFVEMHDYNPKSLAMIAKVKLEEMELKIEEGLDLEPYFHGLKPKYLELRNASVAVTLVHHALSNARKRTLALPPSQRKGASRVLRKEDLDAAVQIIRSESDKCGGHDDDYGIFV